MTETKRLWVLGGKSLQIDAIEDLLHERGEDSTYATAVGQRVNAVTAYIADSPKLIETISAAPYTHVYFVECFDISAGVFAKKRDIKTGLIGSIYRGQLGFGKTPAEFMAGSTIGQVITILAQEDKLSRWISCGIGNRAGTFALQSGKWAVSSRLNHYIPEEFVLLAASEYLDAAYRGECPGVDSETLKEWRVHSLAKFEGRTGEQVLADIKSARTLVQRTRERSQLPLSIADLRDGYCRDCGSEGMPTGGRQCIVGNKFRHNITPVIPELFDAAALEGVACLSIGQDFWMGQREFVLQCASPAQIEWFGGEFKAQEEYSAPARGIAGGLIK